jgi:hypothetical protein
MRMRGVCNVSDLKKMGNENCANVHREQSECNLQSWQDFQSSNHLNVVCVSAPRPRNIFLWFLNFQGLVRDG